jgi:flagellar biosynthetic protein FlhB
LEESQDQRTEQPTFRKKEKARDKGKVAQSTELTAAFVIIGGIVTLRLLLPWIVSETSEFATRLFSSAPVIESFGDVRIFAVDTIVSAAKIMSPFFLAMISVALVANYVQVGFLFSTEPLALSLEKINPVSGFKRLFSVKSLEKLGVNLAKAALVAVIFYYSIKAGLSRYVSLGDCSIGEIVKFLSEEAFVICIKAGLIFAVVGIADYAFQHRQYIKSLMMTKREVKDEYKEIEGSPLIKSRIRAAQRQLARQRMMKAVPTADVVVTNPIHIAVAIKYDSGTMDAPMVVAKGKRLVAERIKQIAEEHDVPIFENRPLAQSLYELAEVGSEIPQSLYKAVAEILSYVYRLKGRLRSLLGEE